MFGKLKTEQLGGVTVYRGWLLNQTQHQDSNDNNGRVFQGVVWIARENSCFILSHQIAALLVATCKNFLVKKVKLQLDLFSGGRNTNVFFFS